MTREIFLQGISIHEETPYYSGRAYSKRPCPHIAELGKGTGMQLCSLAHYPHNEEMVRYRTYGLPLLVRNSRVLTIHWENKDTLPKCGATIVRHDCPRQEPLQHHHSGLLPTKLPHSKTRLTFL